MREYWIRIQNIAKCHWLSIKKMLKRKCILFENYYKDKIYPIEVYADSDSIYKQYNILFISY